MEAWGFNDELVFKIAADTPTRCSCVMCGNPRRHFGEITVQEMRADLDLIDGGRDAAEIELS